MLDDYYRDDIYGWGTCSPVHPTAMMLIPGTVDQNPHSTYEGLSYGDMPLYMSAANITSFWSSYNNTDVLPVITNVEDISPNDGSTVERKMWLNGANCSSVQELKVIGGDHDWPGVFGNMDIDATNEIWNFVSRFSIEGKLNCYISVNDFNFDKKLVQVYNVISKNSSSSKIFLEIYNDGSVEKKIKLK